MKRISDHRRRTNKIGKVHGTMEDNTIMTATETQEDKNGGAEEIQDNMDGRQGQR